MNLYKLALILGSILAFGVGFFSRARHIKIGTPVTTMSGAWRYRVSAGTG